MHKQEVGRVIALADLLRDTRRHRNGGNARGANQRVHLAAGELIHQLSKEHAEGRTDHKGGQAKQDDEYRIPAEEHLSSCRGADRNAEENRDDVHQLVLGRFEYSVHDPAFPEDVAEHEHADQRRRVRQEERDENRNDNREQDFLQLGNGTQLLHDDAALLLRCEASHNRRLDNRHERHIRISGDCDWTQ